MSLMEQVASQNKKSFRQVDVPIVSGSATQAVNQKFLSLELEARPIVEGRDKYPLKTTFHATVLPDVAAQNCCSNISSSITRSSWRESLY